MRNNDLTLWNVTDPADATRIATLTGTSGFIDALAFSPSGNLLADISYRGTVTMYSLANPARPARVATMQPLPAAQLAENTCNCAYAYYTLAFAADGRTLTAVVSASIPPHPIVSPDAQTALPTRDYVFVWNVTSPQSVTRIAVFSRLIASGQGNPSLPLLAPGGHTVAAGAPFGSFGMQLWTLP
jgi:WD40 repeat protein